MITATVHDVLYYMSPAYCQDIIDSVLFYTLDLLNADAWKLMGDEVLVVFLRLVCKSNAVRCCHHLLCLLWLGLVML